jgi:hypothetical protein
MSPQLRVNRLRAFPPIAKEFIIVAVANEATLFISDQTVLAFSDKPLAHSLQIRRIKVAICRVAIMQLCVCSRWFWLLKVHFPTLVIAH